MQCSPLQGHLCPETQMYIIYILLCFLLVQKKKKKKRGMANNQCQWISFHKLCRCTFLQTLFSLLLMTLNWASHGDAMQYCYGNPNLLFWHQRLDDSSTNWKTILFNKNNKNLFKNWRRKNKNKNQEIKRVLCCTCVPFILQSTFSFQGLTLKKLPLLLINNDHV